jgi:hypothetical protein
MTFVVFCYDEKVARTKEFSFIGDENQGTRRENVDETKE